MLHSERNTLSLIEDIEELLKQLEPPPKGEQARNKLIDRINTIVDHIRQGLPNFCLDEKKIGSLDNTLDIVFGKIVMDLNKVSSILSSTLKRHNGFFSSSISIVQQLTQQCAPLLKNIRENSNQVKNSVFEASSTIEAFPRNLTSIRLKG